MKIHMAKKTLAEMKRFCKENDACGTATVCFDNDSKKVVWHIGTGHNWELYTFICELKGCKGSGVEAEEYILGTITYSLEQAGHELA